MILFTAISSYIVQMTIIPKSITMGLVFILALLLIGKCLEDQRINKKILYPTFVVKMAPFYCWVVLSALWSINSSDYISFALIRTLLAFEYGIATAYFCRNIQDYFSILKGFIFGGIVSSIVVLSLQHQFIGSMRLGGFIYGSPMEFSGGLIVSNISALILWGNTKNKFFLIASLFFFSICALSGSRSALVIPILFFAIMNICIKQQIFKIVKITTILVIVSSVFFVASQKISVFYEVVGFRIEQLIENKTSDGSYTERKIMKDIAIDAWKENPICGLGLYGFGKKLETQYGKNVYSHCDYAELLSCFGLVGTCLFYAPIISIFYRKKIFSITKNNLCQGSLFSFFAIMVFRLGSTIYFLSIKDMMIISLLFTFFKRTPSNKVL